MFHPLLQAHLAMADLHCIQGERHLGEQRRNAAELVSGGFQELASQANELLDAMTRCHSMQCMYRDSLRKELGLQSIAALPSDSSRSSTSP